MAGERVGLGIHYSVFHIVQHEQNALDFSRENLAAADINHLACAAEDAQPFTVDFDHVAGIEIALITERASRIELAEHGRLSLDQNPFIDDFHLIPLPAEAYPQRRRVT